MVIMGLKHYLHLSKHERLPRLRAYQTLPVVCCACQLGRLRRHYLLCPKDRIIAVPFHR